MDILYYIGKGSHHQNRELLYSLRALERHCQDIGDVWIVGNRPHFLNDQVKYIWIEDKGQWWQNAFYKTIAAINAGISEDFLLFNDDFYMLKDFYSAKYPYYHRGEISDTAENMYQKVILNTKLVLQSLGKPVKHYGVHCPMRINAIKYKELAKFYENEFANNPVSARCLYGNLFCKGKQIKDCKSSIIKQSITGCWSSKEWITSDIFENLEKMFPHQSRWEKTKF